MQLFTTGDKYEGEWYKDVRQGRGTFHYHGNDVYTVLWPLIYSYKTRVNGMIINARGRVNIPGRMVTVMKEIGKKVIKTAKGSSFGRTEMYMRYDEVISSS